MPGTTSLDFTQVPSDLQRYTKENPEVLQGFFSDEWKFLEYFDTETGVVDRVLINAFEIKKIAQPGGKRTGGTSFHATIDAIVPTPRFGEVKKCKVDLLFTEQDIDKMWKSYLAELKNRAKKGMDDMLDYEAFFLQLVVSKFKEDIHKDTLYKGVRNDAGTAPVDCFDGMNKVITDSITSLAIPAGNVFDATGPVTTSNAVAQVAGVKGIVNPDMLQEDMVALMSPAILEMFNVNYLTDNKSLPIDPRIVTDGKVRIDRTNIELIGEIGLTGSSKIIITKRKNFVLGMNGEGDISNFKVQEVDRDIKWLMDTFLGVWIKEPKYVWVNDLA